MILRAIFGDSDTEQAAKPTTTTVTVTRPAPPPQSTSTVTTPPQTIADAQAAIDDDAYADAIAIADVIGRTDIVRRRIANPIARRVQAALRAGDRGQARRLLARAERYPSTALTRRARGSYCAARARATQRVIDQRAAAHRRRDQQAAEQAEPDPGGNCDPHYSGCVPPYPPDVNCPQVAGPVQVTGSDPHGLDRDNDGIACE